MDAFLISTLLFKAPTNLTVWQISFHVGQIALFPFEIWFAHLRGEKTHYCWLLCQALDRVVFTSMDYLEVFVQQRCDPLQSRDCVCVCVCVDLCGSLCVWICVVWGSLGEVGLVAFRARTHARKTHKRCSAGIQMIISPQTVHATWRRCVCYNTGFKFGFLKEARVAVLVTWK